VSAVIIRVTPLSHFDGLALPAYETADAAGMDLRAAVTESVVLSPGARAMIPTGLTVALPQDTKRRSVRGPGSLRSSASHV
jgi:dUTP pyrophosphatase